MTSELLLRVDASDYFGSTYTPISEMRKRMVDFATEVQKRLGLPNDERFLLWQGTAGTYYEQCHLHILVQLYKMDPEWIPKEIKHNGDIAFVDEEICRVYDIDDIPEIARERKGEMLGYVLNLAYCAEPILYEEAVEHLVKKLK